MAHPPSAIAASSSAVDLGSGSTKSKVSVTCAEPITTERCRESSHSKRGVRQQHSEHDKKRVINDLLDPSIFDTVDCPSLVVKRGPPEGEISSPKVARGSQYERQALGLAQPVDAPDDSQDFVDPVYQVAPKVVIEEPPAAAPDQAARTPNEPHVAIEEPPAPALPDQAARILNEPHVMTADEYAEVLRQQIALGTLPDRRYWVAGITHRLQVMIDLLDQHGLWRVLDYLGLGADDGNVERLNLDQLPAARQKELFWFVLDELISYVQRVHAVADEVASAGYGTPRAPAAD